MSVSDPNSVSRFVHIYKGVEDFYFLNRGGDLGYIKSGEIRSVKETFPQLRDRRFLESNPDFLLELEEFLRELGEITIAYAQKPQHNLELGYVLPASGHQRWHTSTLVLHKHVLEALKADHEMMVRNGTKEPFEAKQDLSQIAPVQSIHRGLDELTHHKDAFGRYRYFPALFLLEGSRYEDQQPATQSRLRVVNLLWCRQALNVHGRSTGDNPNSRELVFHILRNNLTQRGAIDRSRRHENRLSA